MKKLGCICLIEWWVDDPYLCLSLSHLTSQFPQTVPVHPIVQKKLLTTSSFSLTSVLVWKIYLPDLSFRSCIYLSFISNRKDGTLPNKKYFFQYNNKNCEKESQNEVIIFRNGASKSFLSVVQTGMCF